MNEILRNKYIRNVLRYQVLESDTVRNRDALSYVSTDVSTGLGENKCLALNASP